MATDNEPSLTDAELAMAKASNMTAEEYAHYRDRHAGPYRNPEAAEHERLKQAIREALDERERGAA